MFKKWRAYESARIERAWKETKWTTFLGWSFFTGCLGVLGQWETGVQSEHDAIIKIGVAFACAFIGGLCVLLLKLMSLPAKMAAELQDNHAAEMKQKTNALQALQLENQQLTQQISDDSWKLNVTAAMSLISRPPTEKFANLKITVVNMSNKPVYVNRVAILGSPFMHLTEPNVKAVTREITIRAGQMETIQPRGDSRDWEIQFNQPPDFTTHAKDGDELGGGYVQITSGEKFPFEFVPLDSHVWNMITQPTLSGEFKDRNFHRCTNCGTVFLVPSNPVKDANARPIACHSCGHVDEL